MVMMELNKLSFKSKRCVNVCYEVQSLLLRNRLQQAVGQFFEKKICIAHGALPGEEYVGLTKILLEKTFIVFFYQTK